jgi:hypothetical protein
MNQLDDVCAEFREELGDLHQLAGLIRSSTEKHMIRRG